MHTRCFIESGKSAGCYHFARNDLGQTICLRDAAFSRAPIAAQRRALSAAFHEPRRRSQIFEVAEPVSAQTEFAAPSVSYRPGHQSPSICSLPRATSTRSNGKTSRILPFRRENPPEDPDPGRASTPRLPSPRAGKKACLSPFLLSGT